MNASEAVRLIDRATLPGAVQSRPQGHLRRAAENLSRRTLHRARAELAMSRLHLCIGLLYERDEAGQLVNVDEDTGRILVPLPWGKAGAALWGLTGNERDALRAIVRTWALFWYDRGGRCWCVDLLRYPSAEAAHDYVELHAIGVAEWRAAWVATWRKR